MKVYRFMSQVELDRYQEGGTLENRTDWKRQGHRRSTSVGFCFFGDDVPIESRLHYVSGIVTFEAVAEFEADNGKLVQSVGFYRDLAKDDGVSWPLPVMAVTEYCARRYSRETFRLIRTGEIKLTASGWRIRWKEKQ